MATLRAVSLVALIAAATLVAAPVSAGPAPVDGAGPTGGRAASEPVSVDVRQGNGRWSGAAMPAGSRPTGLDRQRGDQGIVDIDRFTGTPRMVGKLDGMLTGPSRKPAREVAMDYLREHAKEFGLSADDLNGLQLARDYEDIEGIHHLSFVQTAGGLTLFGNGVKVNVARDGRIINISGSPVSGVKAPAGKAALSGAQAVRISKRGAGEPRLDPAAGDTSKEVLFAAPGGIRRAWQTVTMSAKKPVLDVIDAQSGAVLYRQQLTHQHPAEPAATAGKADASLRPPAAGANGQHADVVDNYPGAAIGGEPHQVNLNDKGWLPPDSKTLSGNNVHTFTDANANDATEPDEEIAPAGADGYRFQLKRFFPAGKPGCQKFVCTWDPGVAWSWRDNASRIAAQNFYFVNLWHDYLLAAPIGFTEAAGNFQKVNSTGMGVGGDAVEAAALFGAGTENGLPGPIFEGAGFTTPPDGQPGRLQTGLIGKGSVAVNGSDSADVVFHEYTHGLTSRLVVDATNVPALSSFQGGAVGEASSDWYAEDYLVDKGLVTDTAEPGEVKIPLYLRGGAPTSRALDCPVGVTSPACPGTAAAGPGGYTYGDMGKISSRPGSDAHADGQIWSQTMWDVRTALGSELTRSLLTRGLELSPTYPSMLDVRNAIIQADQAINHGKHVAKLWQVFAARGMGFFAGSIGGSDQHPVENFDTPRPAGTPRTTVRGTVTDAGSGAPVAGVPVVIAGLGSGPAGRYAGVSEQDGTYTIDGLLPGTYPNVRVGGAGYEEQVRRTVTVPSEGATVDWQVRRNWTDTDGGAVMTGTNDVDEPSCERGPASVVDGSRRTTWASTADLDAAGKPTEKTPKFVAIELPATLNVDHFAVDPSNGCWTDKTAATGDYRIETSVDGAAWQTAATGRFTPGDIGKAVRVDPTGATGQGVRFIRLWLLTPQAVTENAGCPAAGVSGCTSMAASELLVFGKRA
ncbi:M36 family metallopeptidase [Amycolatopsis jejuensis]|uniref:M36 family metallopeptidase n=1 Tax=Amycolatopsis jejuensis TaxID=330084 RepID=UPI00138DD309|nr:M36 family metallopeptidase [Amycolatopsis jejuensis]